MFHNDKNINFDFRNFYIKKYVQNKTKTLRLLRIDDIINNEKLKYVIEFNYENNNINLNLQKNLINFQKKNIKSKLSENIEMNLIAEFTPKLYITDLIDVLYVYYRQKNYIKNKKIKKFMNFYIEKKNKNVKNEIIYEIEDNEKSKVGILEKNVFDTLDETLNEICKNLKKTGKKNFDDSKSFTFLKNSKIDFRDVSKFVCKNRTKFRSKRKEVFLENENFLKNLDEKKFNDIKETIFNKNPSKKLLKNGNFKNFIKKKTIDSLDKNLTKIKIRKNFDFSKNKMLFDNLRGKNFKDYTLIKLLEKNSKKYLEKFNFNIINYKIKKKNKSISKKKLKKNFSKKKKKLLKKPQKKKKQLTIHQKKKIN